MPEAPRQAFGPTDVFAIEAPAAECERLVAELYSLGTLGIEERDGPSGATRVLAYFAHGADVGPPVRALADAGRRIEVSGPRRVAPVDWEREWRRGLSPRQIAGLWVRPSWCASVGSPEIVIDPQQAFGSGEHATTRLSLELLLDAMREGDRVLDVGSGSGILGLAALRMGAAGALGVDLDPIACRNAHQNLERNALPLQLVCATLDALDPRARFDVVVCNMLLGRMEPLLARLAAHAKRVLIVSGQLASERARLDAAFSRSALAWQALRETTEEQSGDRWCARLLTQARALQ